MSLAEPSLPIHELIQPLFECVDRVVTHYMTAKSFPLIHHPVGEQILAYVFVEPELFSNLYPLLRVLHGSLTIRILFIYPVLKPRIHLKTSIKSPLTLRLSKMMGETTQKDLFR